MKTSGLSINLLQCSFLNRKQVIKSDAEHKSPAMQGDNKWAGEVRESWRQGSAKIKNKSQREESNNPALSRSPGWDVDAEQQGVVSQSAERRFRFLGASSPVAGGLEQQPGRGAHVLSTCLFLSADFAENVSLIFWDVALTGFFLFLFSFYLPLQFLSVWPQFFIFFNVFLAKKFN